MANGKPTNCGTAHLVLICLALVVSGQFALAEDPKTVESSNDCAGSQDVVVCLKELSAQDPNNLDLRKRTALYLIQQGDERGALAEIEFALTVSPNDIDLHRTRANLLKQLGENDAAGIESAIVRELKQEQQNRLVLGSAEDADEIRTQAHLAAVAGENEMASRLYQRYFEVVETPDHSNLCRYAIVLARLEESDDALAIIEMAFSVVREDDWSARAAVWEQKAVVDRILGDDVGAQMDMKEYEACSKKVVQ